MQNEGDEKEIGCTFCDDGIFAEMSLELAHYCEKAYSVEEVHFDFYHGNIDDIKEIVALVDKSWCQYFINETMKVMVRHLFRVHTLINGIKNWVEKHLFVFRFSRNGKK